MKLVFGHILLPHWLWGDIRQERKTQGLRNCLVPDSVETCRSRCDTRVICYLLSLGLGPPLRARIREDINSFHFRIFNISIDENLTSLQVGILARQIESFAPRTCGMHKITLSTVRSLSGGFFFLVQHTLILWRLQIPQRAALFGSPTIAPLYSLLFYSLSWSKRNQNLSLRLFSSSRQSQRRSLLEVSCDSKSEEFGGNKQQLRLDDKRSSSMSAMQLKVVQPIATVLFSESHDGSKFS
jgi:hypothetical protein